MMLRRDTYICSVASLCLVFSMAEYVIPKPFPFFKLGLANLPLLLILPTWDWASYFAVVALKIFGSLLVGGTLFSPIALITLGGGFASALAMKGLSSILRDRISLLGLSVMGAMASNLAQISIAAGVVYGPSIWVAAPLLCLIGLASGVILGLLANSCMKHGLTPCEIELPPIAAHFSHPVPFLLLAIALVLMLFEKEMARLFCIWIVLLFAQKGAGKRVRLLYPLLLMLSLVLLSLFEPAGKILWSWGPFSLASVSLASALKKGLRLMCMVAISQTMVVFTPQIPGRVFRMLSMTLAMLGTYQVPRKGTKPKEIITSLFSPKGRSLPQPHKTHPLLVSILSLLSIALCLTGLL